MATNEEVETKVDEHGIADVSSRCGISKIKVEDVEQVQSLLPGIPIDITTSQIFSRLPWTMLCDLSLVKCSWRRVLEDRQVYDARRLANCSQQILVAVIHLHPATVWLEPALSPFGEESRRSTDEEYAISLYDPLKNKWILLPDFPYGCNGRSIPYESCCVVLNGRLYIIGGEDDHGRAKGELYMLDLAKFGRRVWQQCASMSRPRSKFSCQALHGKIYAFGGSSSPTYTYLRECEVYDPEQNVWRPIASMVHHQRNHSVVSLEGVIYLHGGTTVHEWRTNDGKEEVVLAGRPHFAQVYRPETDKWEKVMNFEPSSLNSSCDLYGIVVMKDKMYRLQDGLRIHLYDVPSNSWTVVEWGMRALGISVYAAAGLGNGFLTIVTQIESMHLLSKEFRGKDVQFDWKKIRCPHPFGLDFQLLEVFAL